MSMSAREVVVGMLRWVQSVLVRELVKEGDSVCHIFCGRGEDAPLWLEACISRYTGIDFLPSTLQDAREEWAKWCAKPLPSRSSVDAAAAFNKAPEKTAAEAAAAFRGVSPAFFNIDPCLSELHTDALDAPGGFDAVCCSSRAYDCFLTEATARQFVENVSRVLKPGGVFFGIVPDSSTIWYKYQKAAACEAPSSLSAALSHHGHHHTAHRAVSVRSSQYVIAFDNTNPFDSPTSPYGIRYSFRLLGSSASEGVSDHGDAMVMPAQPCLLLHFPTFIRLCEAAGLDYIDIQNLESFFEDHRVRHGSKLQELCAAASVLNPSTRSSSGGSSTRTAQQMRDLLGLNAAFIFRKKHKAGLKQEQLEQEQQQQLHQQQQQQQQQHRSQQQEGGGTAAADVGMAKQRTKSRSGDNGIASATTADDESVSERQDFGSNQDEYKQSKVVGKGSDAMAAVVGKGRGKPQKPRASGHGGGREVSRSEGVWNESESRQTGEGGESVRKGAEVKQPISGNVRREPMDGGREGSVAPDGGRGASVVDETGGRTTGKGKTKGGGTKGGRVLSSSSADDAAGCIDAEEDGQTKALEGDHGSVGGSEIRPRQHPTNAVRERSIATLIQTPPPPPPPPPSSGADRIASASDSALGPGSVDKRELTDQERAAAAAEEEAERSRPGAPVRDRSLLSLIQDVALGPETAGVRGRSDVHSRGGSVDREGTAALTTSCKPAQTGASRKSKGSQGKKDSRRRASRNVLSPDSSDNDACNRSADQPTLAASTAAKDEATGRIGGGESAERNGSSKEDRWVTDAGDDDGHDGGHGDVGADRHGDGGREAVRASAGAAQAHADAGDLGNAVGDGTGTHSHSGLQDPMDGGMHVPSAPLKTYSKRSKSKSSRG